MANLINFSQIKGGKQLREEVTALLNSYDAAKVLTSIAKEGGGNYSVNEMLSALRTSMTDLEASVGGNVDAKIEEAKAGLQSSIDLINNKVIKDRVKLSATLKAPTSETPAVRVNMKAFVGEVSAQETDLLIFTSDGYFTSNRLALAKADVSGKVADLIAGDPTLVMRRFMTKVETLRVGDADVLYSELNAKTGPIEVDGIDYSEVKYDSELLNVETKAATVGTPASLQITGDVSKLVPSVDTTQVYTLYGADNKPLRDQTGGALTYNFSNGSLSGVPSALDKSAKEVKYTPIVADTQVKLFPVGTFKFSELKEDYLLDNIELNTVSYDSAIDEIVVGLAQDQELIDSISALVGNETVQAQIKLITDTLAARLTTLETDVNAVEASLDTLKGGEAVEGSIDARIKAAKDALHAEVEAEKAARAAALESVDGRIDALESSIGGNVSELIQVETDRAKAAEKATQDAVTALGARVLDGRVKFPVTLNAGPSSAFSSSITTNAYLTYNGNGTVTLTFPGDGYLFTDKEKLPRYGDTVSIAGVNGTATAWDVTSAPAWNGVFIKALRLGNNDDVLASGIGALSHSVEGTNVIDTMTLNFSGTHLGDPVLTHNGQPFVAPDDLDNEFPYPIYWEEGYQIADFAYNAWNGKVEGNLPNGWAFPMEGYMLFAGTTTLAEVNHDFITDTVKAELKNEFDMRKSADDLAKEQILWLQSNVATKEALAAEKTRAEAAEAAVSTTLGGLTAKKIQAVVKVPAVASGGNMVATNATFPGAGDALLNVAQGSDVRIVFSGSNRAEVDADKVPAVPSAVSLSITGPSGTESFTGMPLAAISTVPSATAGKVLITEITVRTSITPEFWSKVNQVNDYDLENGVPTSNATNVTIVGTKTTPVVLTQAPGGAPVALPAGTDVGFYPIRHAADGATTGRTYNASSGTVGGVGPAFTPNTPVYIEVTGRYGLADIPSSFVMDTAEAAVKSVRTAVETEKARAEAAEAALVAADEEIATNVLNLQEDLTDEVARAKAAEQANQTAITATDATVEANRKAAHNANLDRQYEIALANAKREITDVIATVTDSQTEFDLSEVPNSKKVKVIVNGLVYLETVAFTVNRATKKVTWNATSLNDGFDMASDFSIVFEYETTDAVAAPTHI